MAKYVCPICGYVYDESAGSPDQGIAPGTLWQDLPENWACPLCGAPKSMFTKQADPAQKAAPAPAKAAETDGDLRALSFGELAALCTNLAKGCEKQYRAEEAGLFFQLADYYAARVPTKEGAGFAELSALAEKDLAGAFPAARGAAGTQADRGSLRAVTWGEKVTRILVTLLGKYAEQGGALLENTNIYVCDICGFVYMGGEPPEVCPVCKVPSMKIRKIEREAV